MQVARPGQRDRAQIRARHLSAYGGVTTVRHLGGTHARNAHTCDPSHREESNYDDPSGVYLVATAVLILGKDRNTPNTSRQLHRYDGKDCDKH